MPEYIGPQLLDHNSPQIVSIGGKDNLFMGILLPHRTWKNWMVKEDLPTPPSPITTSLYVGNWGSSGGRLLPPAAAISHKSRNKMGWIGFWIWM
jgi:hypothetical protein